MADKRWHRDELILALDLYYRLPHGQFDKKTKEVIALSELLQTLPVNTGRADGENFRSPNSVAMKLSNFSAIDPDFSGKGLESYSQKDVAIWNEFHNSREGLRKLASEITVNKPKASPSWEDDEIILGLDVFWKIRPEPIMRNDPRIVELSRIMNALDIHPPERRAETFRSPNGIAKVLQLYVQIETGVYNMIKPGKDAIRLYQQYDNDREALHRRAAEIRRRVGDLGQTEPVPYFTEESGFESSNTFAAEEGSPLYRRHIYYERKAALVKSKKAAFKKEHGHLACEACGFDFEATYGTLGENFIECHHLRPLSETDSPRTTTHHDLALLCANCHRMIHKLDDLGPDSLEELRGRLSK
ncbi:MAG: HNH endonuclease [Cyclobacteriaceae bacterium]